jgi:hypothetical protein
MNWCVKLCCPDRLQRRFAIPSAKDPNPTASKRNIPLSQRSVCTHLRDHTDCLCTVCICLYATHYVFLQDKSQELLTNASGWNFTCPPSFLALSFLLSLAVLRSLCTNSLSLSFATDVYFFLTHSYSPLVYCPHFLSPTHSHINPFSDVSRSNQYETCARGSCLRAPSLFYPPSRSLSLSLLSVSPHRRLDAVRMVLAPKGGCDSCIA